MNLINLTLGVYSLLLIIGGFMGFAKAGSIASLIMGVGSGLILGYCTMRHYLGKGLHCMLVLGLTTAITLFFAYRYYTTLKIFPPAIMVACGLLVIFVLLLKRPKNC